MSKDAFTAQYQDVANRAGEKLGVDPKVLLAQWGLETGWGASVIPGTNNLGNIKDFSGKGVEAVDNATKSRDKYRAYGSVDEFADDFVGLIKRRYPAAVGQKTAQGFAEALKKGGYAEDPEYVRKITTLADAEYTPSAPVAGVKDQYEDAISRAVQGTILRPGSKAAYQAAIDNAQFDRTIMEEARPTGLEMYGAGVAKATTQRIVGGIIEGIWGEEFAPVPGYKPDLKALPQDTDTDLLEDYATATSPQAASKVLNDFENERQRRQAVNNRGQLAGFGYGVAAELTDVGNILTGSLVARGMGTVGIGSLALARQGKTASAVGAAVTENMLSGTALEAAAQAAEGRFNGQDLMISMVADSLLGVAGGAAGVSAVRRAEGFVSSAATTAIAREIDLAHRAEQRIGQGASVGELRKVMDELAKEDMQTVVRESVASVPPERVLATEPLQKDLTTDTRFASADNAAEEANISTGDGRYTELRKLGMDLPDTSDVAARAAAIEALPTTPGIHLHASAKSNLAIAKMAESIEKLRAQLIPDVAIHIARGDEYLTGNTLGVHALVKPGVSTIALRPNSGALTAVHELGHAVFAHKLAALPPEKQAAMRAAWQEWREIYVTPGKAQEAALRRSPVSRASMTNPVRPDGTTELPYAAQAAKGAFPEALLDVWDRAWPNDPTSAEQYGRYFANFDEYSAEQFVKYVEAQALKTGDKVLTVPQQVIQAISFFIQQALELFGLAKRNKLIEPDAPFGEFFDDLLAGNVQKGVPALEVGDTLLYRGVRGKFDEAARQDFEWWALDKEHAEKYARGGDVVKTRVNTEGFRVVPEDRYSEDVLQSAYTANEPGVKVVDDTGQPIIVVTFDKPGLQAMATPAKPAEVVNELMTDPDAIRFGLTALPVKTAAERKQAQAMLALHKQAAAWAGRNPMDETWNKRVQNLADNNLFNVASTGLLMLKSPSPLVRMIASELLEDASGVAGKRQATAAISKYMTERFMLGNAINDVQSAYSFWKVGKPGGLRDDLVGGNNWAQFNREVAGEIEARRLAKGPVSQDPNIKAAADSLEAAYQRTANAQREAQTLGASGLPESSVGYMPHRMSPKAVMALTNEQSRILHGALTDQFVTIEGWGATFADGLASSYMKRVRDRATGDYGSNIGGGNPSTNSLVEEALRGMDLPEATIKAHMDRFTKGAANFTKGRIELDLNRVYRTETGDFRLLDIFETNQLELLRSQAGRASGEVALTKFGVRGKPGLKLLRDAIAYGEDGKRAGVRESEAFDQMAAEFLNEPFGTQAGKFMERAMAANTLARLGGIVFNQIAESVNGIVHVGASRALSSVASIPRLRGEIKDLAAGKSVDNPFLSSIELAGGAEFGTDAYKIVMPFDSPDHAFPTYGQDTLTLTDRLLRGGGYLQAKLSGWRMIHSAQQRGMAEQIVHKMARYLREGKDDVALQQFGITDEVRQALRAELPQVATFDASGNLVRFDVTKISDLNIREQVIQAVWRGTSQIIQGTYIGERGKWAHDGWMKMLTQFRTFSITSMEKQWGRQRNSRGGAAAWGLLLGSMSIAAPVYMARVYANSVGRPDQEEFLEERLQPAAIARATLNYVAMSGMAGDFIDLTSSLLPDELGVKPTGGRSGVETEFVGNYVLPASSLVNDIWKYAQSPMEIDDAARILPMSRLPYLVPFANATKD